MIAKGFGIGVVCLLIGAFIGYQGTVWEMDKRAEILLKGIERGKQEALKKK